MILIRANKTLGAARQLPLSGAEPASAKRENNYAASGRPQIDRAGGQVPDRAPAETRAGGRARARIRLGKPRRLARKLA